jgi:methylmalonyl-CoA/ethylmalonyl-CoA epimerase
MIEGVGQIAVRVRDAQRAKVFYRDALGLPVLFEAGPAVFFDCGGVRLMLGPAETEEFDHAASIVYYKVADIAAAYDELRSRGVAFRDAPHRVYRLGDVEGWMCFLQDPEGNTLALMSERRL